MLKLLFITSASHTLSDKNFNHFQRVYFLSRYTELTILACKGGEFSASAKFGTKVIHSLWTGKAGLLFYGIISMFSHKAKKYDIVLTEPTILGVVGFFCKLLTQCKWVVDIWDIPIRCTLADNMFTKLRCSATRLLMQYLYRSADLFIVSIIPDFQLRRFSLPNEKMFLLPNAIWFNDMQSKNSLTVKSCKFNMLCMRSVYSKDMGLDTLTQAFLILQKKISSIFLTIIGRIPHDVKPQVESLRNNKSVKFIDFVEHDELQDLIGRVCVAVVPFKNVPDLAQTYPIKVLEYLAQGQVVIASNIEGLSRMIRRGKNGVLFRAGDAEDLARKIMQIYNDKQLRVTLSKNATKLDEKNNCVNKNKKIYEELIKLVEKRYPISNSAII